MTTILNQTKVLDAIAWSQKILYWITVNLFIVLSLRYFIAQLISEPVISSQHSLATFVVVDGESWWNSRSNSIVWLANSSMLTHSRWAVAFTFRFISTYRKSHSFQWFQNLFCDEWKRGFSRIWPSSNESEKSLFSNFVCYDMVHEIMMAW